MPSFMGGCGSGSQSPFERQGEEMERTECGLGGEHPSAQDRELNAAGVAGNVCENQDAVLGPISSLIIEKPIEVNGSVSEWIGSPAWDKQSAMPSSI